MDVVKEVLENYKARGIEFDTVTLLQPTSPLRTAENIIEGYRILKGKSADVVIAVCEMEHSLLWANKSPEDNSMKEFIKSELKSLPRQSVPTYYRINGALYIVKVDYLLKDEDIYWDNSYAIVMSKEHSVDIIMNLILK